MNVGINVCAVCMCVVMNVSNRCLCVADERKINFVSQSTRANVPRPLSPILLERENE
jgi:hypothetical protein